MIRIAIILTLFSAVNGRALLADYNPFPSGQQPTAYALTKYQDFDLPFHGRIPFVRADGSRSPLTIEEHDGGFELGLDARDGHPEFRRLTRGAMVRGVSAGETDLNQDGKPDYVVITRSGGSGLAMQVSFVLFLLSSPAGYASCQIAAYDAELSDLIDLDRDGQPEFVHEFFVEGEKGRDDHIHNYWVFNLLTFRGVRVVSANHTDGRFPCWILYSHRPNRRATDQLDGAQRESSWATATAEQRERWFEVRLELLRQLTSEQSKPFELTTP